MRDNDFKNGGGGGMGRSNDMLSPRSDGGGVMSYCVCGLPKPFD